ncbi:hypothetical protein [Nocardia sp. NPDC057030]|uniref:hypothetical protein n=1 Tax=unclassified Nocardia TaxID=2637762 RepID=UPI0036443DBF
MLCCALLSGLALVVGPRLATALSRRRPDIPETRHRPPETAAYLELLDASDHLEPAPALHRNML